MAVARNRNSALRDMLQAPVVPVVTITDPAQAVPLARALSDGGLPVIEVTLRSEAALEAIRLIAQELGGRVVVGAGTVRSPEQAKGALAAGSQFLVSPGVTPRLIEASFGWRVPFLPGVATASEAMALADMGFEVQKFFPAESSGGVAALKALAAPLPDIVFCPTGGIHGGNAGDYLALGNVITVGGSWVAPKGLLDSRDWPAVVALAATAAGLAA